MLSKKRDKEFERDSCLSCETHTYLTCARFFTKIYLLCRFVKNL